MITAVAGPNGLAGIEAQTISRLVVYSKEKAMPAIAAARGVFMRLPIKESSWFMEPPKNRNPHGDQKHRDLMIGSANPAFKISVRTPQTTPGNASLYLRSL